MPYIRQPVYPRQSRQHIVCPPVKCPVVTCPIPPKCPLVCPTINNKSSNPKKINIDIIQQPSTRPINPAKEYDYRAFNDPMVPPKKRGDYDLFPSVATQGYPSGYRKMGLLIDKEAANDDPYKFMVLMGRQKYPRSSVYEYYVTENKNDSALKFDLPSVQKELMSDDTLEITDLGKTYTTKIDKNLTFEYNPFSY